MDPNQDLSEHTKERLIEIIRAMERVAKVQKEKTLAMEIRANNFEGLYNMASRERAKHIRKISNLRHRAWTSLNIREWIQIGLSLEISVLFTLILMGKL